TISRARSARLMAQAKAERHEEKPAPPAARPTVNGAGVSSPLHFQPPRRLHVLLSDCPLPPHPGPLSWGEGESLPRLLSQRNAWIVREPAWGSPSPQGRGLECTSI